MNILLNKTMEYYELINTTESQLCKDLFEVADVNNNESLDLFEYIKFMRMIDHKYK